MHFVTNAEYISDFSVLLTFEDGSVKSVDLKGHLDGEIFEALVDVEYFRGFQLNPELGTITWDNGADFCPDFLYEIGSDVEKPASMPQRG